MDFGKIVTLIITLLSNTGALSDIIKLVLQLVSKIAELNLGTASAPVSTMDVAWVQRSLAKLGFDPGPIDNSMGPKTAAAIAAYQKARGLVVDGWLGAETQTKLRMEADA